MGVGNDVLHSALGKKNQKGKYKHLELLRIQTLHVVSLLKLKNNDIEPHLSGIALAATLDQSLGKMP